MLENTETQDKEHIKEPCGREDLVLAKEYNYMIDLRSIRKMIIGALEEYFQDNDKCKLAIANNYIVSVIRNNKTLAIDNDDYTFLNLIENILKNEYDKKQAQLNYFFTFKSLIHSQMIESLSKQKKPRYGEAFTEIKIICYLDKNVFTRFINDKSINFIFPADCIVPYSPAHIEEIDKSIEEFHEQELQKIRDKTGSLEVVFNTTGGYCIYKEDPLDCYNRIHGSNDRELAENERIIDDKIQDIIFEGYRD